MNALDYKITKKTYPGTNQEHALEFVFKKDPNLFLRKDKIYIRGAIEVHEDFVVENGFVHKLFNSLQVEVDSQQISINKVAGDYFLTDFIYKYGNYNTETISTVLQNEGYFDILNAGGKEVNGTNTNFLAARQVQPATVKKGKKVIKYHFCFLPSSGFLRDSQPLMTNTELKLKFDRAPSTVSFIKKKESTTEEFPKYLEIVDCYAQTEYVSSPLLRQHFERIENMPIIYEYDECQVYLKNLDQHQNTVRLNQFRGGNLPSFLFAGIIPSDALSGKIEESSTGFKCHGVKQFNLTLDGSSVNGFPISIETESPVFPLVKFNETTNKTSNISTGGGFTQVEFSYNFLWSHHFESETTSSGWLDIEVDLNNPLTKPYTLVIWCIAPYSFSFDKFHDLQAIQL